MEILICTDGTDSSVKAAELVTKFGFPTTSRVLILGVSERAGDENTLTTAMDLIQSKIGDGFSVDRKIRHGNPIDEILAEAFEAKYDLVVLGGGGSQLGLLHPQIGSTTGKLARKLHTHFLVARNIPLQFEKILFCAGPDTPAGDTMSIGGNWISNTNAQIGLLHVITTNRIEANVNTGGKIQNYDALIDQFNQQLVNSGVKNKVVTRIRQGLVVEEVLKELSEGGYQLLVIGSHYLPGQDLWQGTLLDDITDQVLNRSSCSVLII